MGRGVPLIATMVNITRYHNACAATSLMRRITALAQVGRLRWGPAASTD